MNNKSEPTKVETQEKPLKRAASSGTSFECYECSDKDSLFCISSMASARKHFEETGHSVIISAYFTSVFGTEEQYREFMDDNFDY